MPRLPELSYDALDEKQKKVHDGIASGPRGSVRGPFSMLLHSPHLAERVSELGEFVHYRCAVPQKLRELVVLIIARHWTSDYEWAAHEPPARKAGLTDAVVEALRRGERPDFDDPAEAEIYDFCTELLRTGRVSDEVFAPVNERLGDAATVDLVGLIGHYCLVAMTINVFEIPTRDGSAPFGT